MYSDVLPSVIGKADVQLALFAGDDLLEVDHRQFFIRIADSLDDKNRLTDLDSKRFRFEASCVGNTQDRGTMMGFDAVFAAEKLNQRFDGFAGKTKKVVPSGNLIVFQNYRVAADRAHTIELEGFFAFIELELIGNPLFGSYVFDF